MQALIFDSVFNSFRGIIAYFRIFNGIIKKGDKVKFVATDMEYFAEEVGVLKLEKNHVILLKLVMLDILFLGIEDARELKLETPLHMLDRPTQEIIKGFVEVKSMVFAGIYPVETNEYEELRTAMETSIK